MSSQQQQYTSLDKYFYIDTKHEPVITTQIQQTSNYKYPIIIQPEPVKDILIRITPYKSDYCLN
jgi:hypothetical protein